MQYENLVLSIENGIAVITISREKALNALHAKEVHRTTPDPALMNEALLSVEANALRARLLQGMQHKQPGPLEWLSTTSSSSGLADLVELGIGAALSALLSD